MADFKKLSAVESVGAVSDTANVLIEENGVIKKAPKGEVGGVKVTSAAEVGQTIRVKEIDANGKPTEWECVNLHGTHFILWDQTEGKNSLSVTDGLYEAISRNCVENFAPIHICLMKKVDGDESTNFFYCREVTEIYASTNGGQHQVYAMGVAFFISKDGNHSYYED